MVCEHDGLPRRARRPSLAQLSPHLYQARVERGGKKVALGGFATAEEAALHVARSPEGRAAAQKEAAAGSGSQPKRRRLKCPFVK